MAETFKLSSPSTDRFNQVRPIRLHLENNTSRKVTLLRVFRQFLFRLKHFLTFQQNFKDQETA